MLTLHIPPHLDLHYVVDDYTDPWRTPGTILLLHGNAESSVAWYGWVPQLAPWYRVVRPDMRGFGASTPMPRDFPWTLDLLIDDFCQLMDTLGVERFHLVGAKIGGTIARVLAARRPARVRTLTVVGTPPPYRVGAAERAPALMQTFEQPGGVERWAQESMGGRLGRTFRDSLRMARKGGHQPPSLRATSRNSMASADWPRASRQVISPSMAS